MNTRLFFSVLSVSLWFITRHWNCPDIGKARRVLGWEPQVSLEEGLRQTIAYFRKKLELA